MKLMKTWYVIADSGRGRVLAREGRRGVMHRVLDHDFVAPHLPDQKLTSDRPGRGRAGPHQIGHGYRHTQDRAGLARQNLAKDLAAVVDDGMRHKAFDRLCLVAPPEMLGVLRRTIGPQSRRCVTSEIPKDLTHMSVRNIPDYLSRAGYL